MYDPYTSIIVAHIESYVSCIKKMLVLLAYNT